MAVCDFLPFAIDPAANVDTQGAYAGAGYQLQGLQPGIVLSKQLNKGIRQGSVAGAALMNWVMNTLSANVLDNGDLPTLIGQVGSAIAAVAAGASAPHLANVPFSTTPVFDCSTVNALHAAFSFTLTGDVVSSTIVGALPGQLVTLSVVQDGAGNHTFIWPSNMSIFGAGIIDKSPNQVNVQHFIVGLANDLNALGPMVLRV